MPSFKADISHLRPGRNSELRCADAALVTRCSLKNSQRSSSVPLKKETKTKIYTTETETKHDLESGSTSSSAKLRT